MDLLFSLALVAVFAWALSSAQGFRRQARLFPTVIGVAGLLLALSVLVFDFRNRRIAAAHVAPAHPEPARPAPAAVEGPLLSSRPFITIWAWILGFVAAIYLLGFMIAVPLATFAYLRFGARESLLTSGIFALGCGAVFYAMFGQLVRIPFESGWLIGLLEG